MFDVIIRSQNFRIMVSLISNSPPRSELRSSTLSHYTNFHNHTYTESALSYRGSFPWNTLPPNLTSLLSFREALKTHLFKLFLANVPKSPSILLPSSSDGLVHRLHEFLCFAGLLPPQPTSTSTYFHLNYFS